MVTPESIASSLLGLDHALGHGHVGDLDAVLRSGSSRMLSRMRTFGMMMPISPATFCRTPLIAVEQIAAALRIGQANQADADLDLHRVDGEIIFDPLFGRLLVAAAFGLGLLGGLLVGLRLRVSMQRQADAAGADRQQRHRGRLVKISMPRNPPVTASACGRENSCA